MGFNLREFFLFLTVLYGKHGIVQVPVTEQYQLSTLDIYLHLLFNGLYLLIFYQGVDLKQ